MALFTAACSADVDTLDAGNDDAGIPERACGTEGEPIIYGPRVASEIEGCTVYRGSLAIRLPDDVEDLAGLYALREVVGSLNMEQCFGLSSLHGLERVERVGSMGIGMVPMLEELRPLASLRGAIERDLVLSYMDSLVSLHGLDGVESVGATLVLRVLAKLETLDGLGGLRSVGELVIWDNASLRSLAGLSALETVDGTLEIKRNPMLPQSEIDAFMARVEVRGDIIIEGNGL
jgi:hypothetical protein